MTQRRRPARKANPPPPPPPSRPTTHGNWVGLPPLPVIKTVPLQPHHPRYVEGYRYALLVTCWHRRQKTEFVEAYANFTAEEVLDCGVYYAKLNPCRYIRCPEQILAALPRRAEGRQETRTDDGWPEAA